jgi:hypothetical protein
VSAWLLGVRERLVDELGVLRERLVGTAYKTHHIRLVNAQERRCSVFLGVFEERNTVTKSKKSQPWQHTHQRS